MNFNSTAADALRGVNIGSFMNNPNPHENMRVYFAITPMEGWGRSNPATGHQFGLHGVDDFGRPRGREEWHDDEVDNDDVVIIIMRCWQLHNRRCNNIVRRIVNMGVAYQVAYNEAKSEGLLWPLWNGSHDEKAFIEHMVVVESSEELEEMIENDIMNELERRVTSGCKALKDWQRRGG
jgi:hypothetical protein